MAQQDSVEDEAQGSLIVAADLLSQAIGMLLDSDAHIAAAHAQAALDNLHERRLVES